MSGNLSKKLVLIAIITIVIVGIVFFFIHKGLSKKVVEVKLLELDTTSINKIEINPSFDKNLHIVFVKNGSSWTISNGKITTGIDEFTLSNMIHKLNNMKIKTLETCNKDSFAEYILTDSLNTRIKIYENSTLKADFLVGKFSLYGKNNDQGKYFGNNALTYVRKANNDSVFGIDDYLDFAFVQSFNNWRNQTIIKTNSSDITKLTFTYNADSSFLLEQKNKQWFIGNIPANEVKVEAYLKTLSYIYSSNFNDTLVSKGNAVYKLTVEGKNMQLIDIKAFENTKNEMVLNSSMNKTSFFNSSKKGIVNEIFKRKQDFVRK